MHLERLKDISVYYWLKNLLQQEIGDVGLTIVDEFPETDLNIPTISVEWDEMTSEDYEMGNRQGDYVRSWYLNVFAKTGQQRDDLAYKLIEALEQPIPVYDYNQGFPPSVTPDKIGSLQPTRKRIRKIKVMSELVEKLYYRAQILYIATYNKVQ